ncbi:MAG: 4Fe-4S dicluster domain-containing protein [Thermodesulfobacteriota bacterium]
MTSNKEPDSPEVSEDQDDYWGKHNELEEKGIRLFTQVIYRDWCKACGICIAFCPKNVYGRDEEGKPVIERSDDCIGCLFCEIHCPDFAITIQDRYPDRRKEER